MQALFYRHLRSFNRVFELPNEFFLIKFLSLALFESVRDLLVVCLIFLEPAALLLELELELLDLVLVCVALSCLLRLQFIDLVGELVAIDHYLFDLVFAVEDPLLHSVDLVHDARCNLVNVQLRFAD